MIGMLFRARGGVVCSVHERPDHADDVLTRGEELVFVRDGFSWPVAILPPLALLLRGAWAGLAAYIVTSAVIVLGLNLAGASGALIVLALIVVGIVFGFEAAMLERWRMTLTGWEEVGVASGTDLDECERRFFDAWLPAQAPPPRATPEPIARPSLLRSLFASRP